MANGELERLEAEYTDLGGRVEVKAHELSELGARLGELPGLLAGAAGKKHSDLAVEFGQVKAKVEVAAAELQWLQDRQSAARVAIFRAREAQAQGELAAYLEGEYRRAVQERDETERAVRTADHRAVSGSELVGLRAAKEQAAAYLALVVGPKRAELVGLRDKATEERKRVEGLDNVN